MLSLKCCALQEKSWLRSFYYDLEKCIRQNESDAEFAEVCFFALQKINQHRNEHDEKDAFSPWLLNHQVVSLDTLMKKHKDIFSGFLVCNAAKADTCNISGKSWLESHARVTSRFNTSLFIRGVNSSTYLA